MPAAAEPVQPRDAIGLWQSGGPSANTQGLNQYSLKATLARRLTLAIDAELVKRPECVTSFAEEFCNALEAPKEPRNLAFLSQLCKDRVAELVAVQNEPLAPPSAEAEGRSETTWLRFSEEFDRRHAGDPGVAIEVDPISSHGAD